MALESIRVSATKEERPESLEMFSNTPLLTALQFSALRSGFEVLSIRGLCNPGLQSTLATTLWSTMEKLHSGVERKEQIITHHLCSPSLFWIVFVMVRYRCLSLFSCHCGNRCTLAPLCSLYFAGPQFTLAPPQYTY